MMTVCPPWALTKSVTRPEDADSSELAPELWGVSMAYEWQA